MRCCTIGPAFRDLSHVRDGEILVKQEVMLIILFTIVLGDQGRKPLVMTVMARSTLNRHLSGARCR
jgi:hypothetical protein